MCSFLVSSNEQRRLFFVFFSPTGHVARSVRITGEIAGQPIGRPALRAARLLQPGKSRAVFGGSGLEIFC